MCPIQSYLYRNGLLGLFYEQQDNAIKYNSHAVMSMPRHGMTASTGDSNRM